MHTTPLHLQAFNPEPFIARRNSLIKKISAAGGGVAIIPTAAETLRNGDAHHDFRPASSFYYLTGFCEPEAVLVLSVTASKTQSILFCREKNIEREIWDGYRYGPEAAESVFAMDACYAIDQLNQILPNLLSHQTRIFAPLAHNTPLDNIIAQALNQSRAATRSGATAPTQWHDIDALIHEARLIKDDTEKAWLHAAGQISARGHIRAMQACSAGLRETDLEAEILYSFAKDGAQHTAYSSIVAAGANACVLHYRAGHSVLNDGDLCLIDAGAEYGFYAGDITRTFPVNGRFSVAQKAVYEVVLAAQNAAIAATRAGTSFMAPHDAALEVLVDGMLDLKLLDKQQVGTREDVIASGAYREFYMHRTSHWIGLDVHDVGSYSEGQAENNQPIWRTLQSGMVLTIEPGLYIRSAKHIPEQYWNIGIRIEDNAIVTDSRCELTTRDVPVTVADIEHLMKDQLATH